MGLRGRVNAVLAGQLRRPHGAPGRLITRGLNKRNGPQIEAAVGLLGLNGGDTAADVGFGGGVGLGRLLDAVAPDGVVHGVEISATALSGARRRQRGAIGAGRLVLHQASVNSLPMATGSIDGLISINTIYFLDDLDGALRELGRVLADAGRLVIGLGDPEAMAADPLIQHGFRLRPVDDVRSSIVAAGFAIDAHERVGEGGGAFHLLLARRTASAM